MNRKKKSKPKRQTLRVTHPRIKRRKEDGRPKGTLKRFPFEQTKLGFILKYEAPLVYDIILDLTPHISRKNPPFSLISAVCGASNDPLFQKPKFMRYLEEYRQLGVYCSRGKVLTPEREEYYEKIRKVKLDRYIRENRDEIDRLMRQKFFDE